MTATRTAKGLAYAELKLVEDQIKEATKQAKNDYLAQCKEDGDYSELETAFGTLRYQAESMTETASIPDLRKEYPRVYNALKYQRKNSETIKFIKPKAKK